MENSVLKSNKNNIVLENGIIHILSDDEIKIIRLALKGFNWCDIICSDEKEQKLRSAYENLSSLFLHNLD